MRQIRRLLRFLPHSITLSPRPGGLLLTWEDNEAESFRKLDGGGPEYKVVLHTEQCISAKAELFHSGTGKSTSPPTPCMINLKLNYISLESDDNRAVWVPSAVRSPGAPIVCLCRLGFLHRILRDDLSERKAGDLWSPF